MAAAQERAEAERSEKAWSELKSSSDVAALQSFRDRYPRSPHIDEAERRIGALQPHQLETQLDDAVAWDHAKNANSVAELQAFKHFFPNSAHLGEADKAIAALQNAAEDEKRNKAEAEKAKQADEACRQEAADVTEFVKARSEGALTALRARSACPKTIAVIDEALRDLKTQECASERDQVRDLGSDLEGLRNALTGFTCEPVAVATRSRIAQLEQQAALVAKACEDARYEVDNKTDAFEAGAREKLDKYRTRTDCPAAASDADLKIKAIDERVSNAQAALKKLGCYKAEPSSSRFDRETQEAVGRFQRGAHLTGDATHLTSEFMDKLAAYTGEGVCPVQTLSPPVAAIPRETPAPSLERPEAPRRIETPKPVRPKRLEAVEKAEAAPVRQSTPVRQSAPRPAPAAPAAASGGAKPQIFIPN